MAITNTTQNVSSLVINKVPSANVFKKMKDQNLINENELYLVDGSEIDKYTFTATAGQNTFTIPFEFDGSSSLTLYYNGVMMKENDNYTIAGNVITLVDWIAEEGDYITVMGIQGAAAIDFAKDADKYMKQMEDKAAEVKADLTSTATTAKNDITSTASASKTEIDTIVSTGKNDLNNLISTLPDNWDNVMDKNSANVMGANGKITMDNSYVPSGDNDLVTMKYVSENSYKVGDTLTTARTDLGDDWLLCNGDNQLETNYPVLAPLLNSKSFTINTLYFNTDLFAYNSNKTIKITNVKDLFFIYCSSQNGTGSSSSFNATLNVTKDFINFKELLSNTSALSSTFYAEDFNNCINLHQKNNINSQYYFVYPYTENIADIPTISTQNNWKEIKAYRAIHFNNYDYWVTVGRYDNEKNYFYYGNMLTSTKNTWNLLTQISSLINTNYSSQLKPYYLFQTNNKMFITLFCRPNSGTTCYTYTVYTDDGTNYSKVACPDDVNNSTWSGNTTYKYIKNIIYKFNKWYIFLVNSKNVYSTTDLNNSNWILEFTLPLDYDDVIESNDYFIFPQAYYDGYNLINNSNINYPQTVFNNTLYMTPGTTTTPTDIKIYKTPLVSSFNLPSITSDKTYTYIKAK